MLSVDLIDYLTISGFNVHPVEGFISTTLPENEFPYFFVHATGGNATHDYIPRDSSTFQVIIKGKSYSDNPANKAVAEAEAKRLVDFLHRKTNYMAGNAYVWSSKAVQSNPISLGLDEQDRPMYSTNFIFLTKRI